MMMNKLLSLFLALFLGWPVLAQDLPPCQYGSNDIEIVTCKPPVFDYDCTPSRSDATRDYVCEAECPGSWRPDGSNSFSYTAEPASHWMCPPEVWDIDPDNIFFDPLELCNDAAPPVICVAPGDRNEGGTSGISDDSDSTKKALIAGGIAVAAVAFVKWLNPELPEGASFRPHANVGFRNGLAYTTAGLTAGWENWRLSVASSHHGAGWARPSGRLDYRVEWAF